MNKQDIKLPTTVDTHANTVDTLLSYLHDCHFDETHLTPMHLTLALEYAYQPHPTFWRDFSVSLVEDAMSRHMPNWQARPAMMDGGADRLFHELDKVVRINAFDEANAEMLSALPVAERPTTPSAAFTWITAELERKGLTEDLEFARPDGDRCGEKALDVLYCLEEAKRGGVVERTSTIVAKAYRDAVMKRHAPQTT
ncbi:hypothetical protein PPMP20_17105 [Paraburkholderia phymatum]|uniref:Uncharacterized protein n=1 Tax=Paraburkholderia phymatum (strain DSM 17167 / CIP 108236 / LMG 21445 / STM815) TaxID=391038 RepID=B2JT85_PARP8|nr:hypothetical protein [Paraburkholderia phymatum]ACC75788.1 conserved hypothetical protein [Paraburkholderia phymatum STM815]